MISFFYAILALVGLGVLIFVHELAHYFMALRVGMKVEVFSIGFGKPLIVWKWQGVKWQLAMLPFGGYVRIAGMETKGGVEPYKISGGFFAKTPFARIQVALAGPVANLVLGFLIFTLIWTCGGRIKSFSEHTNIVGWVDPSSQMKKEGISPGDQIQKVEGKEVANFSDLLYAVLFDKKPPLIEGEKKDYWTGQRTPYSFSLERNDSLSIEQQVSELRAMRPASFLLYEGNTSGRESALFDKGSPMESSGIAKGDRIVWVDGEIVFSQPQLSSVINAQRVLLTVERDGHLFLARVPRLMVADLCLNEGERTELDDWRSEAKLEPRLTHLFFLPYSLNANSIVQKALNYVDEYSDHCAAFAPREEVESSSMERALIPGDKIVSVDGRKAENAFDVLRLLQERKILIAVLSSFHQREPISWKTGDSIFSSEVVWNDLDKMVNSIGTGQFTREIGNLHFLSPITPKSFADLPPSESKNAWAQRQVAYREEIEKIKDIGEKMQALKVFETEQKKLRLGIILQDAKVQYNPSPLVLFEDVVQQTVRTLKALVTRNLTPKALAGPVGIVQVMQESWGLGVLEALFWMGVISINLGIFNLLPIPVLDGGYICFALWEAITKQRIKAKTMEKLVIPFIVLLVILFIFTTYNDLARLIKNLF